jgi:hypothetical protein
MSSHITGFVAVMFAAILTSSVPANDQAQGRRTATISFEHFTWVTRAPLVGTYVSEHDEGRMARGEPCTIVYRPKARNEVVVAFRCLPRGRQIAHDAPTAFTNARRDDVSLP